MSKYISSANEGVTVAEDASVAIGNTLLVNCVIDITAAIAESKEILNVNLPKVGKKCRLILGQCSGSAQIIEDWVSVSNSNTSLTVSSSTVSPNPHTHTATVSHGGNTGIVKSTYSTADGITVNKIVSGRQLSAGNTYTLTGWIEIA